MYTALAVLVNVISGVPVNDDFEILRLNPEYGSLTTVYINNATEYILVYPLTKVYRELSHNTEDDMSFNVIQLTFFSPFFPKESAFGPQMQTRTFQF